MTTTAEELYKQFLDIPMHTAPWPKEWTLRITGKQVIDGILRQRPDYLERMAANENALDAYNAALDSGDSALIEKCKAEWLAEWEKFSGQKFWDVAQPVQTQENMYSAWEPASKRKLED
jgi:hypothetical protein